MRTTLNTNCSKIWPQAEASEPICARCLTFVGYPISISWSFTTTIDLLHIRRYTQHHNSKKGKESIAITKVLWYVSESFINPFDFRPHVENETKIKEPSSKIQLTIINTVWQSKHCLKMGFFYSSWYILHEMNYKKHEQISCEIIIAYMYTLNYLNNIYKQYMHVHQKNTDF